MKQHPALTDHASQRSIERGQLAGIGMEPHVRLAIAFAVKYPTTDLAVRLYRHGAAVGDQSEDVNSRESNGSDFWAVCRGGVVTTFMWRRAEQPMFPESFQVVKVFAKGWAH